MVEGEKRMLVPDLMRDGIQGNSHVPKCTKIKVWYFQESNQKNIFEIGNEKVDLLSLPLDSEGKCETSTLIQDVAQYLKSFEVEEDNSKKKIYFAYFIGKTDEETIETDFDIDQELDDIESSLVKFVLVPENIEYVKWVGFKKTIGEGSSYCKIASDKDVNEEKRIPLIDDIYERKFKISEDDSSVNIVYVGGEGNVAEITKDIVSLASFTSKYCMKSCSKITDKPSLWAKSDYSFKRVNFVDVIDNPAKTGCEQVIIDGKIVSTSDENIIHENNIDKDSYRYRSETDEYVTNLELNSEKYFYINAESKNEKPITECYLGKTYEMKAPKKHIVDESGSKWVYVSDRVCESVNTCSKTHQSDIEYEFGLIKCDPHSLRRLTPSANNLLKIEISECKRIDIVVKFSNETNFDETVNYLVIMKKNKEAILKLKLSNTKTYSISKSSESVYFSPFQIFDNDEIDFYIKAGDAEFSIENMQINFRCEKREVTDKLATLFQDSTCKFQPSMGCDAASQFYDFDSQRQVYECKNYSPAEACPTNKIVKYSHKDVTCEHNDFQKDGKAQLLSPYTSLNPSISDCNKLCDDRYGCVGVDINSTTRSCTFYGDETKKIYVEALPEVEIHIHHSKDMQHSMSSTGTTRQVIFDTPVRVDSIQIKGEGLQVLELFSHDYLLQQRYVANDLEKYMITTDFYVIKDMYVPEPKDCQIEWGDNWAPCSAECVVDGPAVSGMQTRQEIRVINPARQGGKSCESIRQEQGYRTCKSSTAKSLDKCTEKCVFEGSEEQDITIVDPGTDGGSTCRKKVKNCAVDCNIQTFQGSLRNVEGYCGKVSSEKGNILISSTEVGPDRFVSETYADDITYKNEFGASVCMSSDGRTALVAAPKSNIKSSSSSNYHSSAGLVYVYTLNGSNWSLYSKIHANNPRSSLLFGRSVSITGDGKTAVLGAAYGRSYIFNLSSRSAPFQLQEIRGDDTSATSTGDDFGYCNSISKNGIVIAVGARYKTEGDLVRTGAVYLFTSNQNTAFWKQSLKINSPDTQSGSLFGESVALNEDGSILIVGEPGYSEYHSKAGAVHIFSITGSGVGLDSTDLDSTLIRTFNHDGRNANFGKSVSLSSDGSTCIVGCSRSDTAYLYFNGKEAFDTSARLTSSDVSMWDSFGCSVYISLDGNWAIVGASGQDVKASNAGMAYIFAKTETGWIEKHRIYSGNPQSNGRFGQSVCFGSSSSTDSIPSILVGAHFESYGGMAHFFQDISRDLLECTHEDEGVPFVFDNGVLNILNSKYCNAEHNVDGVKNIMTCTDDVQNSSWKAYRIEKDDNKAYVSLQSSQGAESESWCRYAPINGDIKALACDNPTGDVYDLHTTDDLHTTEPIDCVGSWSPWTDCTAECNQNDERIQRTFTVEREARNEGAPCSVEHGKTEFKTCEASKGEYKNVGGCSKACGGGLQRQDFILTTSGHDGMASCPPTTRNVSCNTHPCPINCSGRWVGKTEKGRRCNATGRRGKYIFTRWEEFQITRNAAHGGSCPHSNGQRRYQSSTCRYP